MARSPEVRARILELMRDRGQMLAPALFVTFVFYILGDEVFGYATRGFSYGYAWCSAAVLGVVTAGFVLRRVPDRWVHVAGASLLWCTTGSTLVTLSVTPAPGPATGYAADENMRELSAAGAHIIEKPYAGAELRREVLELLDAHPAPPLARLAASA